MSRSPATRPSPLPALALAGGVTLLAIGVALWQGGLGQLQAVLGGALLLILLLAAALATRSAAGDREDDADRAAPPAGAVGAALRGRGPGGGRPVMAAWPPRVQAGGLHDPLTGLPRRALLLELLHKQLAQARRSGELVGVILCDIDDFEAVHRGFGPRAGDQLLQEVGRRMSNDIREADSVARTGDGEFTLIVGSAETPADVLLVAERLLAGSRAPLVLEGREIPFSVSVGVSVFPSDAEQGEELLDRAEAALAVARSQGGGCLRVFLAEPSQESAEPQTDSQDSPE